MSVALPAPLALHGEESFRAVAPLFCKMAGPLAALIRLLQIERELREHHARDADVHRNGKTIDGKTIVISSEDVQSAIETIVEFVSVVEKQLPQKIVIHSLQ